jgi:hypothetical protein
MHLGRNWQALCAPYRIMGAVAPRHKTLITSGSKKGTQIYFFFSLKKSPQTNPLQVPQPGPYGEKYSSTGHLRFSKRPNKNSSNKTALRKERPSMFPKPGAPTEIDTYFRALLKSVCTLLVPTNLAKFTKCSVSAANMTHIHRPQPNTWFTLHECPLRTWRQSCHLQHITNAVRVSHNKKNEANISIHPNYPAFPDLSGISLHIPFTAKFTIHLFTAVMYL